MEVICKDGNERIFLLIREGLYVCKHCKQTLNRLIQSKISSKDLENHTCKEGS